jgi:predicted metalloprotease with PDZ domain
VRPNFIALVAFIALHSPIAAQQSSPRTALVSAPISNIRHEVTFDRASAARRQAGVTMSFSVSSDAPVLLSLPAWTPGAYEISNFARYVLGFDARSAERSLRWDKVDPDTWRIWPQGARNIQVRFDVRADTLDNAMAWSQPDLLFFNGTTVFMYPEGRPFEHQATVVIRTEPEWRVTTGLQSTEPAAAGVYTYSASNYHDLVDMPTFVGRYDLDSMQIADRWTRMATYPVGSLAGQQRRAVWEALQRIIPAQVAVFGDTPWRDYTLFQIADSSFGGASGLEHQSSHVDVITPLAIGNPVLLSLYAHEVFHAWNVKRLRPADLFPYRYDAPQPTEWLWFSEGVTDYYADLTELRGGVIDSAMFMRLTTGKMEEVADAPPVSLEDASLSTWIHPQDGTQYIYYSKGSLAGLALDIMIRDRSDNRGSLDNVLRDLYQNTWKKGQGFTGEQFWSAVVRAAGGGAAEFAEFNRRHIDGREPFEWERLLPLAGMILRSDTMRVPRLGVYTATDSSGMTVTDIEPGSTAEIAGLRPGDILVSVGEIPFADESFGARYRARYGRAASAIIPMVIVRDGREMTLSGPLQFAEQVSREIIVDENAGAKATRIRSGLFHGR